MRSRGGAIRAEGRDPELVVAIEPEGLVELDLRDSDQASLVGRHWAAIGRFLETGDETVLQEFRGSQVAGFVLETDPDVIEELARRGELRFEDIYRS